MSTPWWARDRPCCRCRLRQMTHLLHANWGDNFQVPLWEVSTSIKKWNNAELLRMEDDFLLANLIFKFNETQPQLYISSQLPCPSQYIYHFPSRVSCEPANKECLRSEAGVFLERANNSIFSSPLGLHTHLRSVCKKDKQALRKRIQVDYFFSIW